MPQFSKDVDAYIAKAQPFARPILKKIRDLFHQASPEIEEEMKWSFPHFVCDGIVGSMAGFKQHAGFSFWKASLMSDPQGILTPMGDTSMGHRKLTSLEDLPPDKVLLAYIREAIDINKSGIKLCKPNQPPRGEAKVPNDLQAGLTKNKKALQHFENFNPSQRREYVEWITQAKQEATRQKRLTTALEWISEGKSRHWKYQKAK